MTRELFVIEARDYRHGGWYATNHVLFTEENATAVMTRLATAYNTEFRVTRYVPEATPWLKTLTSMSR